MGYDFPNGYIIKIYAAAHSRVSIRTPPLFKLRGNEPSLMANRKGAIIDAVIDHIAREGDCFSTAQIAADVGCSQSLIFRYFETKEGLIAACFDRVCRDLLRVLKGVPHPTKYDVESINQYMLDTWKAYCKYLESNTQVAKAYLFFVGRGLRFPRGYRKEDSILRRILDDDYMPIKAVYPDFDFVAEYLIMFSYATATGLFTDHPMRTEEITEKIERILKYGIIGYCS